MSFRTRCCLCALTFITLLTANLSAQQPKVLAPHKPIPPKAAKQVKWLTPSMQRSMVGGLWMTDADFKSSIYIKNIVETDPVTVTPILHLSNGAKYTLPDVTIKPADLAIISINDELQKKGISSWATLSGYVELQYVWLWDPFCATIRNVDVSHSLIFTYSLRPTMPPPVHLVKPISAPPSNTVEGMWWKHEKNVSGFIAIANLASQPASATVQISDAQGLAISQHKVTVSSQGMKMIKLPELQTTEAVQGGLRITSSETSDNLVINGGLEDQTTGYSAGIPFATEPLGLDSAEHRTIAELGLMTGPADPMMLFPAGTTFTPYSVLRNVSDAPLSITPTLWWMAGGKPHSSPLPQLTLVPFQTQSLDVASLLTLFGPKNFNGTFTVAFDTVAKRGSLVMSSGSVDQTGNYVFEVIPRGVSEGASKSLQQWSTGNGDDTMITIWNPADEAQDFVFTLFFDGGHYLLPLHMEARETRAFNVSEILQNQVPDAEGNLVPLSVRQGTAKITGSHGENQHILVAVEAAIYNVRKATCGGICQTCDGYTGYTVAIYGFGMAVNGTRQETATGTWDSGTQYNLTTESTWTSSNHTVFTVGSGLVRAVAVGSATTTGTVCEPYPMQACQNNSCQDTNFQSSAPGEVTTVSFSAISSVGVGQTSSTNATVSPSQNTTPISLSITGPAVIVTPKGTFTQNTTVVVQGTSAGTATITATVSNSDSPPVEVGSTSFPVVAVPQITGVNQVYGAAGFVPMRGNSVSNGANYISYTAGCNPANGDFAWAATNGNVTLENAAGPTVTVYGAAPSASLNDTTIQVTCSLSGQTSSAVQVKLTVQKPTTLTKTGTDTTSAEAKCTTSNGNSGCGIYPKGRQFTYQVYDQLSPANPIQAPLDFFDYIQTVSGSDGCNLGSAYTTTCPGNNDTSCGLSTADDGSFPETLSICAPACLSGTSCISQCKSGPTKANQTWTVNGFALSADVKALTYNCSSVLVNGQ